MFANIEKDSLFCKFFIEISCTFRFKPLILNMLFFRGVEISAGLPVVDPGGFSGSDTRLDCFDVRSYGANSAIAPSSGAGAVCSTRRCAGTALRITSANGGTIRSPAPPNRAPMILRLCRGGGEIPYFWPYSSSAIVDLSSSICIASFTAASAPSALRTFRIALSFVIAIISLLSRAECLDAAFTGANGPKYTSSHSPSACTCNTSIRSAWPLNPIWNSPRDWF